MPDFGINSIPVNRAIFPQNPNARRHSERHSICHGLPTAAFTPHATLRQDRLLQFIKTTPDRRASETGDLVHGDDSALLQLPAVTRIRLRWIVQLSSRSCPGIRVQF
jgi:hypothetical protein